MESAPSLLIVKAATLGVVALVTACSSGDSEPEPRARSAPQSSTERTSTTAPATEIDLSEPIPGGSLHGTPRPPLENTGTDYVAIFESLDAQIRWLSENPDPAIVSEIYVPGTPNHDARVPAYQYLVDNGYRWADEGYRLVDVEVLDTRAEAVSLRVVDSLEYERVIDSAGDQIGETRPRSPVTKTWMVVLAPDASGRWRIGDWAEAPSGMVEL